jgi:hypothetical protein
LDDEDIATADVFVDFNECFAVGKGADGRVTERDTDVIGNFLRELPVRRSGEKSHFRCAA